MRTSDSAETLDTQGNQVELAVVLQQEALLRQDFRHSQWRTIILLFGSTLLLVLWFGAVSQLRAEPPRFRSLVPLSGIWLAVPGMMNLLAWLCWAAQSYLRLVRFAARPYRSPEIGTSQVREVLDAYQYTGFTLRRQVMLERVIGLLVAFEVIMMGASIAWLLSGSRDFGVNF